MNQKPTCSSRKTLTFGAVAALIFGITATTVSATATTGIPETINLNIQANHAEIDGLPKDKKSVNSFTHQKHASQYLKGNSQHAKTAITDDFTCAACHLGAKSSADITESVAQERLLTALNSAGGPKKLKNYFHGICLSCHKSMKKAQIATGPTKCSGCHKRK